MKADKKAAPEQAKKQHNIEEESRTPAPLIAAAFSDYLLDANRTIKDLASAYGIPFDRLDQIACREQWTVARAKAKETLKSGAVARRIKDGAAAVADLRKAERRRAERLLRAVDRRLKDDEDAFSAPLTGTDPQTGKPLRDARRLSAGELAKVAATVEAVQRMQYRSYNLATEHTQQDIFTHFPDDDKAIDAGYRITAADRMRATDADFTVTEDPTAAAFAAGAAIGAAGLRRLPLCEGEGQGDKITFPAGDSLTPDTDVPATGDDTLIADAEGTPGVEGKQIQGSTQPTLSGAEIIFNNRGGMDDDAGYERDYELGGRAEREGGGGMGEDREWDPFAAEWVRKVRG